MKIVKQEPQRVFDFFEDLCAIPHGSGNTDAIATYLENFARKRALRYVRDAQNNIIIYKDAAAGFEKAPTVILQGHMDMVCAKDPECTCDMTREGLDLYVDGDFLAARGTTLGGDDGIAVAIALAILDGDSQTPALEAVFTVDEEIGMLGAMGLDMSRLRGTVMLNIDGAKEGVIIAGCAGGVVAECTLPVHREKNHAKALRISVSGLRGGHSSEVKDGRANADLLLARILLTLSAKTALRLADFAGGEKDNVVPSCAQAIIVTDDEAAARAAIDGMRQVLSHEYETVDPGLTIAVETAEAQSVLDEESTRRVICFLANVPNGVYAMSAEMPGLTQTSLSLGAAALGETAFCTHHCVRSSIASQKTMLTQRLASLAGMLGGSVTLAGDYPGWEYRRESRLRDVACAAYQKQTGNTPKIVATHGGLECGIFSGKIAGLDCICIGPDLYDIHSSKERLSLSSAARVYAWVTEILRTI